MTIQKANTIKFFRYLAIFCAITMGFFSIVATSEDDAKDALGITVPFNDEEVEMELETVTVEKGAGDLAQPMDEETCRTTNVRALLTIAINEYNAESELGVDVEIEDIDSIDYDYAAGTYTVDNVVGVIDDMSCTVTLKDGDGTGAVLVTITEVADIDELGDPVVFPITEDFPIDEAGLRSYIEGYLGDIDAEFTVCGTCTGTEALESYTIGFNVDIGILVSGEI